jgi:hypothetical protein
MERAKRCELRRGAGCRLRSLTKADSYALAQGAGEVFVFVLAKTDLFCNAMEKQFCVWRSFVLENSFEKL